MKKVTVVVKELSSCPLSEENVKFADISISIVAHLHVKASLLYSN